MVDYARLSVIPAWFTGTQDGVRRVVSRVGGWPGALYPSGTPAGAARPCTPWVHHGPGMLDRCTGDPPSVCMATVTLSPR